jgi:hypothetical protein
VPSLHQSVVSVQVMRSVLWARLLLIRGFGVRVPGGAPAKTYLPDGRAWHGSWHECTGRVIVPYIEETRQKQPPFSLGGRQCGGCFQLPGCFGGPAKPSRDRTAARPPAIARRRHPLAGLAAPPPGPLSLVRPAHPPLSKCHHPRVSWRMAAAVVGGRLLRRRHIAVGPRHRSCPRPPGSTSPRRRPLMLPYGGDEFSSRRESAPENARRS